MKSFILEFFQNVLNFSAKHCLKSAQIWSLFWFVFPRIRTECRDLRKCPYSVKMQENTDQKKFRIWALFTQ